MKFQVKNRVGIKKKPTCKDYYDTNIFKSLEIFPEPMERGYLYLPLNLFN